MSTNEGHGTLSSETFSIRFSYPQHLLRDKMSMYLGFSFPAVPPPAEDELDQTDELERKCYSFAPWIHSRGIGIKTFHGEPAGRDIKLHLFLKTSEGILLKLIN
uniref:Uncharacterized protein n=2 Tax=Picea TaxID=3328 RepID=A0A124GN01_PICGL|nr:hypothetical protein ABT39_MTgene5453 [Picea glauca]QHR91515.1 hypothetical protein Q903MT_gene5550 [Picea sitchensis]